MRRRWTAAAVARLEDVGEDPETETREALADLLGVDGAMLLGRQRYVVDSDLTSHRENLSYTVDDVARMTGLSRAQVDRVERATLAAPLGHLVAWSSVVGYMPEEVFQVVVPDFLRLAPLANPAADQDLDDAPSPTRELALVG